jgi:hypothetical protein
MSKVLIGYINKFEHLYKENQELLKGEPKEGRIYRIIETAPNESERTGPGTGYQIYVGAVTNPAGMDTIFLGNRLVGQYYDKWTFDIEVITKENHLEFEYDPADLPKLKTWLESDNSDLIELLKKTPFPVAVEQRGGDKPTEKVQRALNKAVAFEVELEKSLNKLGNAVNTIINEDVRFAMILSDLLQFIAANVRVAGMSKQFVMNSATSDGTIFGAIKHIEQYTSKQSGRPSDLHKSIYHLLLELQRSKTRKDDAKD